MTRAVVLPFTSSRRGPEQVRPGVERVPPSSRMIRHQLSRILASEGFVRASRMRRFLEFVVEEALAERTGQLCEYSIGICVFERDESFQPGLDPIVRNDARRLRQKLVEYYRHAIHEQSVIIDIPKGSYVPSFRVAPPIATPSQSSHCKLKVTLTRVADGIELWNSEHCLDIGEKAEEHSFALQFRAASSP